MRVGMRRSGFNGQCSAIVGQFFHASVTSAQQPLDSHSSPWKGLLGCTYSNSRSSGPRVGSASVQRHRVDTLPIRVRFAPFACGLTRLEEFFTHAHSLTTQSQYHTQVSNGCCASSVQQLLSIAPSRLTVSLLCL